MKLIKLIICFSIVNLFYACSASKSTQKTETKKIEDNNMGVTLPVNSPVLQVDPHLQNGKTINLKVNDRFDVVFLRECIGCAEVWRIVNIDKDKISQQESTYKNRPAPGMMGGSKDHIFHFTAKEKGSSTLSFNYFKESSTINFVIN